MLTFITSSHIAILIFLLLHFPLAITILSSFLSINTTNQNFDSSESTTGFSSEYTMYSTGIGEKFSSPNEKSPSNITYLNSEARYYLENFSALNSSLLVPKLELRHLKSPIITKLSIKPMEDTYSSEILENSFEQDTIRLVPLFSSRAHRFTVIPITRVNHQHSQSSSRPLGSHLKPPLQTKSPAHVMPITVTEIDMKPKLDLKKLVIVLFFKLGAMKLKTSAALKVLFFLLLKFQLALIVIFIKFLLFLKAMKLLKKFLLLSLLPALSPLLLLLLPLLFLPLLLPLLLLLPIPIPAAVRNQDSNTVILDYLKTEKHNGISEIINNLLASEKCIERIACQLATKKESKLFYPVLEWYLNAVSHYVTNRKMQSYVNAFLISVKEYKGTFRENDGRKWCKRKFKCVNKT